MEDVVEKVHEQIATLVDDACGELNYACDQTMTMKTVGEAKSTFADVCSTIAFVLAKEYGKPPQTIAEDIVSKMREKYKGKDIEKIEAVGGYVNITLSKDFFAHAVAQIDKAYGEWPRNETKVMIEFPSVNPNKPWHIGHLRNALLGETISRVLAMAGYDVIKINYIDDLGLQIAVSVWGYIHHANTVEGKADHWFGAQYVEAHAKAPVEEVKDILAKMERGEREGAIARQIAEQVVRAQYETHKTYGVWHHALVFESDLVRQRLLDVALARCVEGNVCVRENSGKNAGCIVVKFDDEVCGEMENPDKVVVRSDGTATYVAKDIAFHFWKFGLVPLSLRFTPFLTQWNGETLFASGSEGEEKSYNGANIVVNIIGMEQQYPQRVVAHVLKQLGYATHHRNLIHVAYEHVTLPEGKFSGREGTWKGYTADELAEEAQKRAFGLIQKSELSDEEKKEIARKVGLAAIKYNILRVSPEKKILFRWEEALAMEGDSGPYLQYSYTRACAIQKKARELGVGPEKKESVNLTITTEEERELAKLLLKFPSIVKRCAHAYRVSMLTDYANDLATRFNRFYDNVPVLKAPEEYRAGRMLLVEKYMIVMEKLLFLLGIETTPHM